MAHLPLTGIAKKLGQSYTGDMGLSFVSILRYY
jgi:hypothetical protein